MIVHTALDLVSSWTTFWDAISLGISGPVLTTITIIGVGLIVFSIVKYLWDKRRGQGGKSSTVWWTLLFGGILLAPDTLIPILLRILQWAIDLGLKVLESVW
jgi:hypothetical protein